MIEWKKLIVGVFMKKSTLLMALIFISTLLPLQTDEIKPSVKNFFVELNQIMSHYDLELGMQKKFSDEELFNIAKLLYIATEDDPIGFQKRMKAEYEVWGAETIKNHGKPIGLKPGVKLRILGDIINERFGGGFTQILKMPYYLRIKILDLQNAIYILKEDNNTFPEVDLICLVEDVIKGEKRFKKEDTITVSFLVHWFQGSLPIIEKGNSYFMPVEHWKMDSTNLSFRVGGLHNGEVSSVLMIGERQFIDPENCYMLDSTSRWEIFKSNFLKKYKLN